jgi:hypothetical protein
MVLLSVVTVMAGWMASIPSTHAQDLTTVYLPWVPNDETIGGQGPWNGELSIQNPTAETCPITVYVVEDEAWLPKARLSLLAGQSISTGASALAVPAPGSPMRFESFCEIAVSMKQVTPGVTRPPWADGADVVTGYTGLQQVEVTAAHATSTSGWFLPIVQTNSGWNSFITIANFTSLSVGTVVVHLYPAGNTQGVFGADVTLHRQLDPADIWTIDVREEVGEDGWVGYASISSDVDSGVIVRRVKPETQMAITNVGIAGESSAGGAQRALAPLLFNDYNGWNTGINIANPTDRVANVTVQYFEADKQIPREDTLSIAANSMHYVYTPGTGQQDGFVGSATIVSDTAVVASIDEVKYETIEALSYMASGIGQHNAALPIVFQADSERGRNDNSGINIANLAPDHEATVSVTLLNRNGSDLLDTPISVTLPPGGNSFVYLPFVSEIPPGTMASARLTTDSPEGFVAISNDVNYLVTGDGSVVFSATSADGYYMVPERVQ